MEQKLTEENALQIADYLTYEVISYGLDDPGHEEPGLKVYADGAAVMVDAYRGTLHIASIRFTTAEQFFFFLRNFKEDLKNYDRLHPERDASDLPWFVFEYFWTKEIDVHGRHFGETRFGLLRIDGVEDHLHAQSFEEAQQILAARNG